MIYLFIAGAIVAIVALYAFLSAPARLPRGTVELWEAHYAHRGLYSKDQMVPENSLASFARRKPATAWSWISPSRRTMRWWCSMTTC